MDAAVVADCINDMKVSYNVSNVHKALYLAGSAYEKGTCVSKCIENKVPNYQIIKVFDFPCEALNKSFQCHGHVTVSDLNKHIVVAFRGTEIWGQLIEFFKDMIKDPIESRMGGMVFKYFHDEIENAYSEVIGEKNITDRLKQNYSLWVVGHSLGGAFANVFLSLLASDSNEGWVDKKQTHLITFGAPRVGNWRFARRLEYYFPNIFRIVNNGDIVVHLPLQDRSTPAPIKHSAKSSYLTKEEKIGKPYNPCHSGRVIRYATGDETNTSNFQICSQENDQTCKPTISTIFRQSFDITIPWDVVFHHHLNYLNFTISKVCKDYCLSNQYSDYKQKDPLQHDMIIDKNLNLNKNYGEEL